LRPRGHSAALSAVIACPIAVFVLACPAERYHRPPLPAPQYEVAPVAPWDAGAPAPNVLDPEPGEGPSEAEEESPEK
jgi:hypothetical protein